MDRGPRASEQRDQDEAILIQSQSAEPAFLTPDLLKDSLRPTASDCGFAPLAASGHDIEL